jgi:hypothetical protein
MSDFLVIIDKWPSCAELARDVGVDEHRPRMWRHRGIIPPRYWREVIRAAHARGHGDVTSDRLVAAYADSFPAQRLEETCE